jgi:hypothetical protein
VGTVGAADVPDDASDGEEGEEGEGGVGDAEVAALLAGGNGGGEEAGDPTEGVDWALVLEKVQSMGGDAPGDSRTESEGAAASLLGGRSCTGNRAAWLLPPGLLVFLLPCVALIPFYVSIFQTSYSAVGDVLSTQVCVCALCFKHEPLMAHTSCGYYSLTMSLFTAAAVPTAGVFYGFCAALSLRECRSCCGGIVLHPRTLVCPLRIHRFTKHSWTSSVLLAASASKPPSRDRFLRHGRRSWTYR